MTDLRATIQKKPECLTDRDQLTGVLMDCGLEKRTVQVMLNLYDCGVVMKIRQCGGVVSQTEFYNLTVEQENVYGTSQQFVEEGINQWAEALGVKLERKSQQVYHGFCGKHAAFQQDENGKVSYVETQDGNNLTWTYDRNGTLTISGAGEMGDFFGRLDNRPWHTFCQEIKTIKIGHGVTIIGVNAFKECSVSELILPKTLEIIGYSGFEGCKNLRAVSLPEGLRTVAHSAFLNCDQLESILFPDSVEIIGECAFQGCNRLTGVTVPKICHIGSDEKSAFPATVRIICSQNSVPAESGACGNQAVWLFDGQGTLTISGSGEIRDYSATTPAPWSRFKGKIIALNIGNGITKIGKKAFWGLKITDLILPKTVQEIAEEAFYYCFDLKHISLPDGLQAIGRCAFGSASHLGVVNVNADCKIYPTAFSYNVKVNKIDKSPSQPPLYEKVPQEKTIDSYGTQTGAKERKRSRFEKCVLALGFICVIPLLGDLKRCVEYLEAVMPGAPLYPIAFLIMTVATQIRILRYGFAGLEKIKRPLAFLGSIVLFLGFLGGMIMTGPVKFAIDGERAQCVFSFGACALHQTLWFRGASEQAQEEEGKKKNVFISWILPAVIIVLSFIFALK